MEDSLPPINFKIFVIAVIVAALAIAAFMLWRWQMGRRMRAARALAVTSCGYDFLRDILVPDGQEAALHVDFLLLTARGVVVIDLRDVAGNIFGGDQMTSWTVMHRSQRRTFANPQTGLYDRIAAVRALSQELPVEGRIVFTGRGKFPKGLPRHTLMLESLPSEFPASDRQAMGALLERWMPGWDAIKRGVKPSQLALPKAAI
jgi:hypothetical protein